MSNTSELINQTNQTGNSTWISLNPENMPKVGVMLDDGNNLISNMLISWGYTPADIYFKVLVVVACLLIVIYLFVYGTSKVGGLFKWIAGLGIVVVLLGVLGVW